METDLFNISDSDFERILVKLQMADKKVTARNILKVYNEALKAQAYNKKI